MDQDKYMKATSIFLDSTIEFFDLGRNIQNKPVPARREIAIEALGVIKKILARTEQLLKIKDKFALIGVDEDEFDKLTGKPLKDLTDEDIAMLRGIYAEKYKGN